MSDTSANNLSRDNIRQLLAAIGSKMIEDTKAVEFTEYDWNKPHYFNSSQLERLNDFTKQAAAQLSKRFTTLYHSNLNVTTVSTTLYFAYDLLNQISTGGQDDYYLAFGDDSSNNWFGLIGIPEQTAISWVKLMLGDVDLATKSGNSASQKTPITALSQLEESLLFEIASSIVESLSISLRAAQQSPIGVAKSIVRGSIPIELQSIEEICKIAFSIEKSGTSKNSIDQGEPLPTDDNSEDSFMRNQTYLIIPCKNLAHVVGKTIDADRQITAGDISKAIFNHLMEIPISVTAQLASAVVTFEQIMSLRPSDILLLDKGIDEPVELIVEGRSLFRGQPVKSVGQYAVAITKMNSELRI
jgi:flagellar motor switch protein FliN/FliY